MTSADTRRIVLTGCTRGLGRALAEWFAARGHCVFGCGRDAAAIHDLRGSLGEPHDFEALDVAREESVRDWAQRVLARLGPPDLLINNAALMNRPAKLWELAAEEFDPVIDVNIKGVANVVRHIVPAMVERRSGVIVNLSSTWGRTTAPEVAPYCATKFAIEGLTRALAHELPKGMAAVPLNPGIINTDMLRKVFGATSASYAGPERWVESAGPYLLKLGPADNGQSRAVPG